MRWSSILHCLFIERNTDREETVLSQYFPRMQWRYAWLLMDMAPEGVQLCFPIVFSRHSFWYSRYHPTPFLYLSCLQSKYLHYSCRPINQFKIIGIIITVILSILQDLLLLIHVVCCFITLYLCPSLWNGIAFDTCFQVPTSSVNETRGQWSHRGCLPTCYILCIAGLLLHTSLQSTY